MVITSLQEKENRKFYVPIRPGNRGGWSLFEWQSVREMPYRDREMYLGNSAVIGVLDKGGKWRKRDWYLKAEKRYNDPNLTSEQQEAIKRDMERMNAALGNVEMEDDEKLTEEEMKEIMKKIKSKGAEGQEPSKEAVGLGFDKTRVQIRARPNAASSNPNRLEGIDELVQYQQKAKSKVKHEKEHKEGRQHSRSREKKKSKKEKKSKKQKKHSRNEEVSRSKSHQKRERSKQKKEKKQKKHKKKDKQRRRSSSSSRS